MAELTITVKRADLEHLIYGTREQQDEASVRLREALANTSRRCNAHKPWTCPMDCEGRPV